MRSEGSSPTPLYPVSLYPLHASLMLTEKKMGGVAPKMGFSFSEEERGETLASLEIANLRVFILMPFYFDFNARPKCVRRFLIFPCLMS